MKSFLIHFFIFFLFSCHLYGEKIDVAYVGFALSAKHSDLNTVVKYTNKIIEKEKKLSWNIIDRSLEEVTRKLDLKHINLFYKQDITEETSKIAMAVFLDQENLEEFALPIQDCKKINLKDCYIYRIYNHFQIIFFDVKQMTFINAIPFEGVYISNPKPKLNEEEKILLFEEYYKSGTWLLPAKADQGKGVGNEMRRFSNILPITKVKRFYEFYLGINPSEDGFKINIDKISALTSPHMVKDINLLKRLVANLFLAEIAFEHNVPIVPYYEGVAVGGKLRAKYANGKGYDLVIPKPVYYVDIFIRGFLKKEYKKDANVENLTWWIYGAGINLKIYFPKLNKEYLNIVMTKADFKKIPDFMELTPENEFVNIYQLTLLPLGVEFSSIINSDFKSKEDKEWLKKVTKNTTKPGDFKELKKLFKDIAAN